MCSCTVCASNVEPWCATPSWTRGVVVPEGVQIGVDPDQDRARGFVVQDGLTVVAKHQDVPQSSD